LALDGAGCWGSWFAVGWKRVIMIWSREGWVRLWWDFGMV